MTITHQDELRRGERARAILDDPLVKEARERLRAELLAAWEGSPARDAEGREALWQLLKLSDRLFGQFESLVMTGRLAAETLAAAERHGASHRETP